MLLIYLHMISQLLSGEIGPLVDVLLATLVCFIQLWTELRDWKDCLSTMFLYSKADAMIFMD